MVILTENALFKLNLDLLTGATAWLRLGRLTITLNLPQALKYEAELKAKKE